MKLALAKALVFALVFVCPLFSSAQADLTDNSKLRRLIQSDLYQKCLTYNSKENCIKKKAVFANPVHVNSKNEGLYNYGSKGSHSSAANFLFYRNGQILFIAGSNASEVCLNAIRIFKSNHFAISSETEFCDKIESIFSNEGNNGVF